MKKISIGVFIPAIGKKHDFIVPNTLSVAKICDLMCAVLKDEYGILTGTNEAMLISTVDNTVLNKSCSMKQLCLKNGSQFILM